MKILYGSTDVTKYVLSYRKKGDYQEGLLLGQTPSYEIELKVKNTDGVFGDLSEQFNVYEGEEQTGVFTVYEKPERYTKIITLILYDNMLKLNSRYMSELDYDNVIITIKDQLDEMSSLTGLSIDYSNLPEHVLNKKVTWYDNTLSMRNHIGWIAEIAGCNSEINSTGGVIFKEINTDFDFEINSVGDYESEEEWQVSRVCFNNGLAIYAAGNETKNTLYISENNPYCDDQSLIDHIFSKYKGLSLMGISKIKMRGNRALRLGDIVKYNDIRFIVLSLTATEFGGESYPIHEINGVLPTKNEEMAENRIDTSTKIRRLQVLYNQNKAQLSIMAKDKVDKDEIVSAINLSPEEIKILARKIALEGIITANGNIIIHEDGSIEAKNGKFTGKIEGSSINSVKTKELVYSESDLNDLQQIILNDLTPTEEQLARYDMDNNGILNSKDYHIVSLIVHGHYGTTNGKALIEDITSINLEDSNQIRTERRINGTRITHMYINSGSINTNGGSIIVDGEPVVTSLAGSIACFG